jgi:hypothetical protein
MKLRIPLRIAVPIAVVLCLTGCNIIPKPVEYFQDRVQPMPERKPQADESLRQAARLAADRAAATEHAALSTAAAPEVLQPASDTAILTSAVSAQVGPPARAWTGDATALIARMDAQEASYRRELESYRADVRELAGKKIEGTGAIQVGYFTHLLILAAIMAVAWLILKIVAITNAPVSVGLKTIEGGSKFLGRAFGELVEAGQDFKTRLKQRLADNPELLESILADFKTAHQSSQSRDTQKAVEEVKG